MFRKLMILAMVGALGVAAAGVTLASATSRDGRSSKVISLEERGTDFAYVAAEPAGFLGDYLVFHADLFDSAGVKVGTDGGTCVFTSAAGESQCVATLSFAGGDVTTQGLNTDPTIPFEAVFAVTGGTGEFKGAAGELDVEQLSEVLANLTLRLTRGGSGGGDDDD
jgi:hypothetical protein